MSTIGIDFGTTFSSASWVNPKTGFPEEIKFLNAVDKCKIPSIIYFQPQGKPLVGYAPYMQIENANTAADRNVIHRYAITSIKRKMQRKAYFQGHSHVEIISLIIRHVVEEAKKVCNFPSSPDTLVLTHPVVFAEWQKSMLREAACKAGFANEKISLLEEPVSAALAYVNSNNLSNVKGVLVYDFGGGTFDVAYVQKDARGQWQIPIDPQGDPCCGGDDIDLSIYDKWEERVKQQFNRNLSPNPQELDEVFLSRCRKQKEIVSNNADQTGKADQKFTENFLRHDEQRFDTVDWIVRDDEYNNIISPIIDRTISKTRLVIEEIKSKHLPLDIVLLIGGSSRIPLVRHRLEELLGDGTLIRTTGQVDTAVAVGASYYALNRPTPSPVPEPPIIKRAKFCIRCGYEFKDSDNFCMKCGKKRDVL